jgi:undecaprenyl-diphosphatase
MQLNFTSKDAFQISSRWVWLVLALILLTLSIALSGEVIEAVGGKPELIQNIDENLLHFLASHRITALNSPAIDLTALGSTVALTLLVTFLITYFEFTSQRASSVKLLIVSLGSGLLSQVFKAYVGRVRPDQAFRLVNVGGYSYPSGHSVSASAIYFTIAIIFATQLKKPIQRVLIVLMFLH